MPFDASALEKAHPPRTLFLSAYASDSELWQEPYTLDMGTDAGRISKALDEAESELRKLAAMEPRDRTRIVRELWYQNRSDDLRRLLAALDERKAEVMKATAPRGDWLAKIQPPEDEKDSLTNYANAEILAPMVKAPPQLPKLLSRVRKLTAKSGMKTALARFLDVNLSQLSEWLSEEETARKPSGEYALRMLLWVQQQEQK
jgi:hypothetical protein